ncbi:Crp/Fnr family transcriptional regulator [Roseicyclus salinarum]|uniref:Crp/Fnr family transcriptional regulator n=1 Tax=Roseicyclus salinarum TaxID=3036773 RepID=UPI002415193B|nr:cyclic nucleotide-binding domain-containing protein [Roseibacterium sp. SDUM158017]
MIRDELAMRALLACCYLCYIVFYFTLNDTPIWAPIGTNGTLFTINLVLLVVIVRERTRFGMSEEHLKLSASFPTLNPGQFRRVLKAGRIMTADTTTVLTRNGDEVPGLFLIADGRVEMQRNGTVHEIPEGSFIGEISFLIGGPASATVTAPVGTRYIFWDRRDLERIMRRSPALSNALGAMFNRDLARKLSLSAPEGSGDGTARREGGAEADRRREAAG